MSGQATPGVISPQEMSLTGAGTRHEVRRWL